MYNLSKKIPLSAFYGSLARVIRHFRV